MMKKKKQKKRKAKLTMAQELFCYFITETYFNNATRSYAAAYKINLDEYDRLTKFTETELKEKGFVGNLEAQTARYKVAAAGGQENLEKPLIRDRIKERLLAKTNDFDQIDARLAQLAMQDDDRPTAVASIRELNKLRGRITDKKDVNLKGNFSLTDLLKAADEAEK